MGIKSQQIYTGQVLQPSVSCLLVSSSLKDGIMELLRTGVGYFLIPIQSGVKVGTGLYNELVDYGKLKAALAENENLKPRLPSLQKTITGFRQSSLS